MGADLIGDGLDEHVPIDPLLVEPLDLWGSRAKRRHLVEALAHQAAVPWRLESEGRSPATAQVLFRLLDPLAAALDVQRVSITERADAAAAEALRGMSGSELAGVAIDLGASQERIGPLAMFELDRVVEQLVRRRLTDTVTRLLRRWAKRGYIIDITA